MRVLVPVDSTAEGDASPTSGCIHAVWRGARRHRLLVDPDNPVPNGLTGTFTRYASTSEIVLASSAWSAGDKLRLTTTGTLPAGLATGTDYYLQAGTATGAVAAGADV